MAGRLIAAGAALPCATAKAFFAASNFFVVGETEREDEQDESDDEYEESASSFRKGDSAAVVRFCAGTSVRLVCGAGDTVGFTTGDGVATSFSFGAGEGAGTDFFAAAMRRFRAAAVLDSEDESSESYE